MLNAVPRPAPPGFRQARRGSDNPQPSSLLALYVVQKRLSTAVRHGRSRDTRRLILDGLCLHALSSFQRTGLGRPPGTHPREPSDVTTRRSVCQPPLASHQPLRVRPFARGIPILPCLLHRVKPHLARTERRTAKPGRSQPRQERNCSKTAGAINRRAAAGHARGESLI
jgi:hypothetical protein